MVPIRDITDYILKQMEGAKYPVNPLKMQKLLYYAQAWHLAFHRKPLFEGAFQAWVHGPVNYEVFNRFRGSYGMYDPIGLKEIRADFSIDGIPFEARMHVDSVLEAYGKFSAVELESLTHREEPWIAARQGLPEFAMCSSNIDESLMGSFYRRRLSKK
jgi:uncharacterized phage-associated protein